MLVDDKERNEKLQAIYTHTHTLQTLIMSSTKPKHLLANHQETAQLCWLHQTRLTPGCFGRCSGGNRNTMLEREREGGPNVVLSSSEWSCVWTSSRVNLFFTPSLRFQHPSSKLCHNWLHHCRGASYLGAFVCQNCPCSTFCKISEQFWVQRLWKQHSIERHVNIRHCHPGFKKIVLFQFKWFWFYLC